MYKLVISDDEGKTTVVPLIRDEITIGRKEGNTIRLTERNVSRFHARVIRDENEGFIIEDLGSLCGTQVNARILRSESAPITLGDNVAIGDYSLSIRSDVAADVPLGKQMDPGDRTGIGKVTPHARLVMISGPEPGREQDLTAELYVVGRSEEANFRIEHPSISRAHARIDLESGKWTISDLDSINGIFVNQNRKDDYVLKAGDIIRLGSVELRFVAPGEPYEYNPGVRRDRQSIAPVSPAMRRRTAPIAVGIIVLFSAAAAAGLYWWGRAEQEKAAQAVIEEIDTFDSFMERGKDKMQNKEWSEAARLFALALQKRPDAVEPRDLKTLSIQEADAEAAHRQIIDATVSGNWKEALDHFSKIPRSSAYYDVDELKTISSKLCDELLQKAAFVERTGTREDLDDVINEIYEIPMAPDRCRGNKADILAHLAKSAVSDDAGMLDGVDEAMKKRSMKQKLPAGPGRSQGKHRSRRKMRSASPERIMNPYDD